jgi:hypothetical protein
MHQLWEIFVENVDPLSKVVYVSFGYKVGKMPQRNSPTLLVYVGLTVLAEGVQHDTH